MEGRLYLGEAACLGAAFLWAFSVSLFRRPIRDSGAPAVNLFKCTLAATLLGITTLILGQGPRLAAAPGRDLVLIVVSAWIGLTVGDTALFAAVSRIGTYRTLLLQTLAPVFTAILAAVWLGEVPRPGQTAGALLILAGIALVARESRRNEPPEEREDRRSTLPSGWAFGVLAAAGQGIGIVFAKQGMVSVPFVAASFLRMAAAAAGLLLLAAHGGGFARAAGLFRLPVLGRVSVATFLGAYLAMMCMMAGVDLAPAAVAAVLLATTPVFGLILDVWIGGEPLTLRGLAGTLVAVSGVVLLSLS